jgi:hypothetical protein
MFYIYIIYISTFNYYYSPGYRYCYFLPKFCLFVVCCSAGHWIHGLVQVRPDLYYWAPSLALSSKIVFVFLNVLLCGSCWLWTHYAAQAGPKLVILCLGLQNAEIMDMSHHTQPPLIRFMRKLKPQNITMLPTEDTANGKGRNRIITSDSRVQFPYCCSLQERFYEKQFLWKFRFS